MFVFSACFQSTVGVIVTVGLYEYFHSMNGVNVNVMLMSCLNYDYEPFLLMINTVCDC